MSMKGAGVPKITIDENEDDANALAAEQARKIKAAMDVDSELKTGGRPGVNRMEETAQSVTSVRPRQSMTES